MVECLDTSTLTKLYLLIYPRPSPSFGHEQRGSQERFGDESQGCRGRQERVVLATLISLLAGFLQEKHTGRHGKVNITVWGKSKWDFHLDSVWNAYGSLQQQQQQQQRSAELF